MPALENGLTQVFWGNGKGKTTAALGTALRASGSGYKIHLVQFMKNGAQDYQLENPGEILALEKFPNFSFKRFGAGSWIIGEPKPHHIKEVSKALDYLKQALNNENYDIIIADEILYAIQLGLLTEDRVIDIIKQKPKNKELILTGSHIPLPQIFQKADLITEVKKHKHPFDSGILARKGIDY
jgi:cob(I)alamin adenosyltransferase